VEADAMKKTLLQVECLVALRLAGRGPVRRALEGMVNRGAVTLDEARVAWRDAFGGSLVAVAARTFEVSL
jgi:hypothetical protein